MRSRIYLIRHGVTEGNLRRWYYGSTDIPLTDEGYDRIKGYAAQGIYPAIPDDADIYTTGLIRTEETLEAMYGKKEHGTIEKLREIDFGKAECLTYDELRKFDNFDEWAWDQTGDVRIADAETSNEFHQRIYDGLDLLLDKHREKEKKTGEDGDAISLVVCHGGVISCIMEYLFPAVCGSMWDWLPDPGFGYAVDFEDGEPFMYSKINDVGRIGLGIYSAAEPKDMDRLIGLYMKRLHGYFEPALTAFDRKGRKRTGKEAPDAVIKAVKASLIDKYPREDYKLCPVIDLEDAGKVPEFLESFGVKRFDRVTVTGVDKYYAKAKEDPETLDGKRIAASDFDEQKPSDKAAGDINDAARLFSKLEELKKDGMIGKAGVFFDGEPAVLDSVLKEQAAIDFVELPANYVSGYGAGERSQKYYTISRRRYKEILVSSPFDGGSLAEHGPETGAPDSSKLGKGDARKDTMAGYAMLKEEYAPKNPVEWAIRYDLSLPFVTVLVASTKDPGHALMDLDAADNFRPLSEEEQNILRDHVQKNAATGKSGARRGGRPGAADSGATAGTAGSGEPFGGPATEEKFRELKEIFEKNADPETAGGMEKYMRNMFRFYGIKTPERRKLTRDLIKQDKKEGMIDWNLLDLCYEDPHREMQYFADDYLLALSDHLTYNAAGHIKKFVKTRSWWDTIDFLCKAVGAIGLRDRRTGRLMLRWSEDKDFWVRRTAIEHQLGLKEKTDTDLLSKIIENNLGSKEFFINKAIGWALRDYSKTDPEWVRRFIEGHREKLSALSIREGSKYI